MRLPTSRVVPVLASAFAAAVFTTATGCEERCNGTADCRLDEICDREGYCIPTPPRPVAPVGEGEGEGNEGEGEGEGEGGEGEGEGPVGGFGVCASTGDTFDPDAVYLWGTLSEGACFLDALADIDSPNAYAVGFDCNGAISKAQVRSDGRLVYLAFDATTTVDRLRIFENDSHPLGEDIFDDGADVGDCEYPETPQTNDPLIETSGCADDQSVGRWAVQVSSSSVAYLCFGLGATDTVFIDDDAFAVENVQDILGYSGDGLVLVDALGLQILDTSTGTVTPVGSVSGGRVTARALDVGFYLVTDQGDGIATLWEITETGAATEVGDYSYDAEVRLFSAVLDSAGRLYAEGHDPSPNGDVFTDCIYRLAIGQPQEIRYTELDEPLVWIHISHLFSGGSPEGF